MRVLLLGGTGQVGTELRVLARQRRIGLVAPSRTEADLRDLPNINRLIAAEDWSFVINAAAYTDVDGAEGDRTAAFAINAAAPSRLASETGRRGIPLLHISTDYVFDGRKGRPYVEDDRPNPLNVYGQSKFEGEEGVRAGNQRHIILRTSWVYSPFGKNFVKTIMRLAKEREQLRVVSDQRGCPTAASDIAGTCFDIAVSCASSPSDFAYGTYHYAGLGDLSWFEFAKAIVEIGASGLQGRPEIVPIKSTDYPTAAVRPADSRLDCSKIVRAFGVRLPSWQESLPSTLRQIQPDRVLQ